MVKNNREKTKKNKTSAAVMLSGGLDSRLALKIIQEQLGKDNVVCLFFKLPFGSGCCHEGCSFNFSQTEGSKLEFFDCTSGKLFQDHMKVIKNPEYGRGKGVNPCIDCRLFMLKKAKEYIEKNKIDFVVTGEVLGERPMSQKNKSLDIIEKESGLSGKLLRPLSAKLLRETDIEKKGLIDRSKLYDIEGRQRKKQIELAKKFNISYPTPAGGCLLCEKLLKKRFRLLLDNNLIDEKTLPLINIGRHFYYPGEGWFVVGRDEKENEIIERFENSFHSGAKTPAVYYHNNAEKSKIEANKLQEAYKSRIDGKEKLRKNAEKNKI